MALEDATEMEEQQDDLESDGKQSKKQGTGFLVKVLIGAAIVVAMLGAFVLIAYLVSQSIMSQEEAAAGEVYHGQAGHSEEHMHTVEHNLTEKEPIRIVLNPERGKTTPVVVQTNIALAYPEEAEEEGKEIFSNHHFSIREKIENTIAEKSARELNSSDGLENLRLELKTEVNNIIGEPLVQRVIITSFDIISGE